MNNQKQRRTFDQGLKIRTVWVRVPPPLLVKVLDLQEKYGREQGCEHAYELFERGRVLLAPAPRKRLCTCRLASNGPANHEPTPYKQGAGAQAQ